MEVYIMKKSLIFAYVLDGLKPAKAMYYGYNVTIGVDKFYAYQQPITKSWFIIDRLTGLSITDCYGHKTLKAAKAAALANYSKYLNIKASDLYSEKVERFKHCMHCIDCTR